MNNSAVRVLVMPPGEMSSRNNRGYYTKFAALPMTERFSCSVPGDARLNVTMGGAHSHSFPEHPQPYGKPCLAELLNPPAQTHVSPLQNGHCCVKIPGPNPKLKMKANIDVMLTLDTHEYSSWNRRE